MVFSGSADGTIKVWRRELQGKDPVRNLKEIIEKGGKESDTWKIYTYLLWGWWKQRNEVVINNQTLDLKRCWLLTKMELRYCSPPSASVTNPNFMQEEEWIAPDPGKIKINVDGAFKESQAAASAVARDSTGAIIQVKSLVFEPKSPLHSELVGFKLGFELEQEMNLDDYVIEGDSRAMVLLILDDAQTAPWRLLGDIEELRATYRSTRATVQHCYRSSNQVAHHYAVSALTP